ncbi:DUF4034 domain-containing protein [Roseobacter sp. CCS2]|uniref:DUF4034 domain-containing protein n=1 Tax=Roseobacter sp. CCS2 TaxID=391593 RepID=UPI0000F402A6|nr:DUF4034 domain-containing protein [Roseobacter sp. CCS2]EBA12999.1 hypothetical protein RCCS2_03919 [Roseobacter sp. CCS2]
MRLTFLVAILLLTSRALLAQTTPEQIRNYAYSGDVLRVEAAFAQAHQASLTGQISYNDLRALSDVLTVTHPDIIAFTVKWREEYPDSPYAMALRSAQLMQNSWTIRGTKSIRDTHQEALRAFHELQVAAVALAREAYDAAPDYVAASDVVFRGQLATKPLSNRAFYTMLRDVMEATPSRQSLAYALSVTLPNWGGGGYRVILPLCDEFAAKVVDVTGYTTDVCAIDMIHQFDRSDAARNYADGLLDSVFHPLTDPARARRAMARQAEGDRRFLIEYMSRPGFMDIRTASRFKWNFRNDDETEALMVALDARLQANAAEQLRHDPLNIDHMSIIKRETIILAELTIRPDRERNRIFAQRSILVSPYDSSNWESAATFLGRGNTIESLSSYDPYLINAIVYSDHSMLSLRALMIKKTGGYRKYLQRVSTGNITPLPEEELHHVVHCPAIRLARLMQAVCDGRDQDCNEAAGLSDSLDQIFSEVEAGDLCQYERNGSIADLLYTPVQVDLTGWDDGIANR